MMATLVRWQRARWVRHHPGGTGLVLIALLPLLYLLPLQRLGIMFPSWKDGAGTLAILLPLPLAAVLLRDSARVPPAAVWLFQKGLPIEDLFIARWSIDLAFAIAICIWAMLGAVPGSALYDTLDPGWIIRLTTGSCLVAVTAGVLLFGMGASGSARGGDLLVLLVFAGMLEPLLAVLLPAWGRTLLHVLVLPIVEAASLPARLHGAPATALHGALHLSVWASAWLAFGIGSLRRWRPALGAHD